MIRTLSAALAALLLSACSSLNPLDGVADRLMTNADTNEDRALRIGFITVGAAEIAVQRVTLFDPGDAGNVYTAVQDFRDVAISMQDRTNTIFFNVDLFYVERVLIRAAAGRTRAFVTRILVPGIDTENAARAAVALGVSDALKRDVETALQRIDEGTLSRQDAWAAIVDRLDRLLARLEGPMVPPTGARDADPGETAAQ